MKRWALMSGGECLSVVEQEKVPQIGGDWWEVTGLPVGPGCKHGGQGWVSAVASQRVRLITIYAFWSRWTIQERQALLSAAASNVAALDFQQMVDRAEYIDLDDPLWQTAMPQLVALGVLGQDRPDQILNAPIQDRERP